MSPLVLIHHSANRGRLYPPGSLPGLRNCLSHDAQIVEIDLSPTADGDFALLHGPLLERETTGSGPIQSMPAARVAELRHVWKGKPTDVPVSLLGQALELIEVHPHPVELQLDLKPYSPLDNKAMVRLVERLQPVRDRVRVTSGADWLVRYLKLLDSELPLGFDPLLYLDLSWKGDGERGAPPYREGAYGYLDDHPLASRRWGSTADYLAARAEALWNQAPPGAIWYISARLLARALDDGFDWIAELHRRGALVDAWTLDPDRPEHIALAQRLAGQGADRITTNDAPALAQALGCPALY
jgi:glycerophosphoryl diester phosphodiesterase